MSKSSELRAKQRAYNSLLENVSSFNSKLKTAYSQLENSTKIGDHFQIDNESADNNDIKNARKEIGEISNKLTSTIIPAIQNKIYSLSRQIAQAESEGN